MKCCWLNDYARVWLRDWATAKIIFLHKQEKFGALAGPQGGITLNGEALKIKQPEEMTRLEDELKEFCRFSLWYALLLLYKTFFNSFFKFLYFILKNFICLVSSK